MSLTLYHYVHCPFCVRVRMALGYLQLPYTSQVMSYDDETTPIQLSGKKMLPILRTSNKTINESLDIIALVDKENILKVSSVTQDPTYTDLEKVLGELGSLVHSLAMPYWIWTPEFNQKSRQYFQQKKELKRGPFKDLVKKQDQFKNEIEPLLKNLEQNLKPFYQSPQFTLKDILIAAHIWGLYVVPEFQFSEKIDQYLKSVKAVCHFNYHQDFWG